MRVPVCLRRAGPSDVPGLLELERLASTHPWTARQMADEVARGASDCVLVLEGPEGRSGQGGQGRLRAYLALRVVLDEVHVMNLAVAPGQRRRGLGRWLLGFGMRRAARAGARRALLEVRRTNAAAVALYESLGFRRTGMRPRYYRQPEDDALLLEREGLDGLDGES